MFTNEAPSVDVGGRLKELRETRNISMRGLATKSGLSANALSMIERGKTSPSVSTLYKLAEALEVPITEFFSKQLMRRKVVFIKADARPRVPFARGLMETLGGEVFIGKVSPFIVTLENGAGSGPGRMTHTGHEFVFCLRGTLEYQVEGEYFTLEAGDSLLFAAQLRHTWRNPGHTVTNALILIADHSETDRALDAHWSE
jgi:transcriptional regulator with XRE-family HTH domain